MCKCTRDYERDDGRGFSGFEKAILLADGLAVLYYLGPPVLGSLATVWLGAEPFSALCQFFGIAVAETSSFWVEWITALILAGVAWFLVILVQLSKPGWLESWILWPVRMPAALEEEEFGRENERFAVTCTIGVWIPIICLFGAAFSFFEHGKGGIASLLLLVAAIVYFACGGIARARLKRLGIGEAW